MVECGRRQGCGGELVKKSWRGVGTPNLASSLQPPRCHGTDDVGRSSHILASPGRPAFGMHMETSVQPIRAASPNFMSCAATASAEPDNIRVG
ncbi:hypothetical protein CCUS01_11222 [Colletotrichum cuscutae]|uniref:Uncharacterized protein n=1 Tax=Colletotrichum cuscutae TaxID=1209917 RepID=A0AAI9XK95_9PEZI|nr:hypothetical protein CCUS01_11222 [Colletotrichum cuscutae]